MTRIYNALKQYVSHSYTFTSCSIPNTPVSLFYITRRRPPAEESSVTAELRLSFGFQSWETTPYFLDKGRRCRPPCLRRPKDTGNEAGPRPWTPKYWSSSATIKEQSTLVIWRVISARAKLSMTSSATRRNSLCVVPSGSRRWWPGPSWRCVKSEIAMASCAGFTCVKGSSSPDPVWSIMAGKEFPSSTRLNVNKGGPWLLQIYLSSTF